MESKHEKESKAWMKRLRNRGSLNSDKLVNQYNKKCGTKRNRLLSKDQDVIKDYDSNAEDSDTDIEVKVYIMNESQRIRNMKKITKEINKIFDLVARDPISGTKGKLTKQRISQVKLDFLEKEYQTCSHNGLWTKTQQKRIAK